ncbi:MAG: hypothetical protein RL329_1369 [Bacteroidota bacterium]
MKRSTWIASIMAFTSAVNAQTVTLDGYAFEKYNRGFLNEVTIKAFDQTQTLLGETLTTMDGHFQLKVPIGKIVFLSSEKRIFVTRQDTFLTTKLKPDESVYLKLEMTRQPGYLFDAKIANKRLDNYTPTDAIGAARIEIYNNTTKKPELVIDKHTSPFFNFTLQQGNHYTILVRKEGYFNKRMEAHVNIDGCILCFEGIGTVSPGVSDNLSSSEDRRVGTLNANIEMEKIDTTRNIVVQNIYYDFGSANLTEAAKGELDKVGLVLKNNPQLVVELGSHTDSRGSAEANQLLSEQRAKNAVEYIQGKMGIGRDKLKGKGYGEARLVNECEDGTPCNDEKHRQNRRTELKITGFTADRFRDMSLAEIIHEEEMDKFINSGAASEEYKAPEAPVVEKGAKTSEPNAFLDSKGSVPAKEVVKTEVREAIVAGSIPRNVPAMTTPAANGGDKPKVETAKNPVKANDKIVKIEAKEAKSVIKKTEAAVKETTKAVVKEVKETTKTVVKEVKTDVKEVKTAKIGKPADDFDETVTKPVSVTKTQVGMIPDMKRPAPATPTTETKEVVKEGIGKIVDPNQPPFALEQPKPVEVPKKKDVVYAVFPMSPDYSGYRVQFLSSATELKKDDARLKSAAELMSAIYTVKTDKGLDYYLGDFQHWGETERFLTKVKAVFPQAEMIEFFKGKKL